MKNREYLGALLITVALLGCSPKAIRVTGQVFIVTQGAENIKLGAVEVRLIEKQQVTEFLRRRHTAIESQLESLRVELTAAESSVQKEKADYDAFTRTKPYRRIVRGSAVYRNDKSFLTNEFFARSPSFIEMRSQIELLWRQRDALAPVVNALDAQRKFALDHGDVSKWEALSDRVYPLSDQQYRKGAEADSILSKLEDIVSAADADRKNKLEALQSRAANARARLEHFPSAEDYFLGFSADAAQTALSDADGKFSFAYPRNKSFACFASAQRLVLDRTETYCWLINAPTNAETAQVFLNNNNLIFGLLRNVPAVFH